MPSLVIQLRWVTDPLATPFSSFNSARTSSFSEAMSPKCTGLICRWNSFSAKFELPFVRLKMLPARTELERLVKSGRMSKIQTYQSHDTEQFAGVRITHATKCRKQNSRAIVGVKLRKTGFGNFCMSLQRSWHGKTRIFPCTTFGSIPKRVQRNGLSFV